uniref:Charged multivesicular body protein 2a n=1 Tax=Macrostomum lignano TaxID=282301 RepID=A0A1I8GF85_9PLAT
MALDFIFGRRKTPEEMLRQNQRALNRATRDLDRERTRLEREEQKTIMEIKKLAKQGQMDAVKIMAKDLVRTRNYVKKFILMRANIQAVGLKVQTLRSTNQMAQAMKSVTRTMQRMNKSMNLPQLQQIMAQFEKESEIMEMKEEMMSDAIDDAIGGDEDADESEKIVTQVLDELGIDLAGQMPEPGAAAPASAGGERQPAAAAAAAAAAAGPPGPDGGAGGADLDADLEARLNNLKRQ